MMNTRSLVNKLTDFQSFVYSSVFDIFICTETWFSEGILNNEVLPSGFCIYRKDRSTRGGGVMIAVREAISCTVLQSPIHLEVLTITIGVPISLLCVQFIALLLPISTHYFITSTYCPSQSNYW